MRPPDVMRQVRRRIERSGERLWQYEDFRSYPFAAVAQALSRLARMGVVERLSKGVYYRHRSTAFGKSRPNPSAIQKLARRRSTVFSSGIAAANLLGFSTQTVRHAELSTSAGSLPRKLIGQEAVIHPRRPAAWSRLSEEDAALLDFLRHRALASELPPEQTIRRLLELLSENGRFRRLLKAASSEPPRVRAMLGALGEQLNVPAKDLQALRSSLNAFSRFDFGILANLPDARSWQAKEKEHP